MVYLIQQGGFYCHHGLEFRPLAAHRQRAACARSLRTRYMVRLSALEVRYTRRVTLAWAVFFRLERRGNLRAV